MQAFRSRSATPETPQRAKPSVSNPRRSPSPKVTRGSPVSSDYGDSKPAKFSDRKPSPMSQSFQEKQKAMRVSEMQQQWRQLQEELKRANLERDRALEELVELKGAKEEAALCKDKMKMLEQEAEKAKDSESKMLESLVSQTKQLEQTKILFEEAKLEIRNLHDGKGNAKALASLKYQHFDENGAFTSSIEYQEEIRKLKSQLRSAIDAEEKSNKAMDDLAIALKEVMAEVTECKEQLAATKSELDRARAEAEQSNSSLQSTERKLKAVLEEHDKIKLEYEESAIAWKAKEDSFLNCIKISEEDMSRMEQDNSRLRGAHGLAKEENSKLRDIIKQAVNEATVVKESLEIARFENYELNEQLSKKEAALQQIRHDYEILKAGEAAYRESVMEPKRPLASASGADANITSTLSNVDSVRQSNATHENRKITKDEIKFPSDGWTNEKPRVRNGRRHSVGETDTMKALAFETKDTLFASISVVQDGPVSSSLFTHDRGLTADDFSHLDGVYNDSDNEKQKKKKTVFRRFGDALRRRSFRKT